MGLQPGVKFGEGSEQVNQRKYDQVFAGGSGWDEDSMQTIKILPPSKAQLDS